MLAWCHQHGRIISQTLEDEYMQLELLLPEKHAEKLNMAGAI